MNIITDSNIFAVGKFFVHYKITKKIMFSLNKHLKSLLVKATSPRNAKQCNNKHL